MVNLIQNDQTEYYEHQMMNNVMMEIISIEMDVHQPVRLKDSVEMDWSILLEEKNVMSEDIVIHELR